MLTLFQVKQTFLSFLWVAQICGVARHSQYSWTRVESPFMTSTLSPSRIRTSLSLPHTMFLLLIWCTTLLFSTLSVHFLSEEHATLAKLFSIDCVSLRSTMWREWPVAQLYQCFVVSTNLLHDRISVRRQKKSITSKEYLVTSINNWQKTILIVCSHEYCSLGFRNF